MGKIKRSELLKGESGLLGKLQTNSIILGSMAEAVAVIGFIIIQLGGVQADMLRAGFVSLIVFSDKFSAQVDLAKNYCRSGKGLRGF
jgi:hypothetical protein